MNSNVNQLLDADREARQRLDEAQQYYDRTLAEIEGEKKKLLAAYTEKAELHFRKLEEELADEVSEAVEAVRTRTASTIAQMDARYDRLHEQWEDELVKRCIGGD